MKRLLVGTAAVALGLTFAAPAHATLQLGVAGHFKGYVSWDSQDTTPGTKERHLDILRDTEVHFTGETTLDNGLTVGVHVEAKASAGNSFAVDESYAYFSGGWGRINFGDEDGAAYLLQVAAPSADGNVDGIRQYVNPVNYNITSANTAGFPTLAGIGTNAIGLAHFGNMGAGELDYANDATRHNDKLTYLTPVFSGFQAGVSYTPQVTRTAGAASRSFGNSQTDIPNAFGNAWEGSARWEGKFDMATINLGGGYTWVRLQKPTDDDLKNFQQWNLGGDVNVSAFGLGVIYTQNNEAGAGNALAEQPGGNGSSGHKEKTWDVGADYTTGPFKLGASWLNDKMGGLSTDFEGDDIKTNRYSGGVVYSFAPGMSFRGSVGLVRTRIGEEDRVNATYGLLGTQINF